MFQPQTNTPGKPLHRAVPAYILVGFLGSGKTTLLGRIIAWCVQQGLQPGLIINEIGSAWIDSEALRQEGMDLTEIAAGCVCCSADDELVPALLHQAANPKNDLILLEASGLADPADMLDALTDPTLWEKVEVGGIISVVDASRYDFLAQETPLTRRQVHYADVLVLNKCDLTEPAERDKLLARLQETAPRARIFPAENGLPYAGLETLLETSLAIGRQRFQAKQEINNRVAKLPSLALTPKASQSSQESPEKSLHGHADLSVHVTTFDFAAPVDKVLFENFLRGLPKSIYRAKGFIHLKDAEGVHSFQHMPGYTKIVPVHTYRPPAMRGVFIGSELDHNWLSMRIADCQESES